MTCYEKWNLVINILIALGTVGAVVVAIFGNWIMTKIFSAKLDVEILNKEGELTKFNSGKRVIYYHLRIINKKSIIVKNCRVFLKKIQKLQTDGQYLDLPLAVPPRYLWAPAESSPEKNDIVTEQVLDFGYITEGSNQITLSVTPIFNNFKGIQGKNESFRYLLEIIADNYRPKKLITIQIFWDGKWTENLNEMEKSLVIQKI
jgi:hypothetical protein